MSDSVVVMVRFSSCSRLATGKFSETQFLPRSNYLKPTAIRQSLLLALYGSTALAAFPTGAMAQTAASDTATTMQSVSIVGSRRVGNTSSTDTPVPVDYIPLTKAAEQ